MYTYTGIFDEKGPTLLTKKPKVLVNLHFFEAPKGWLVKYYNVTQNISFIRLDGFMLGFFM